MYSLSLFYILLVWKSVIGYYYHIGWEDFLKGRRLLHFADMTVTLRWRHNGGDSVSNHQPNDYLLNRLFGANQSKHQSSASLAFVRGIHRDRWIPRTKGQLRGKCFHLMTSSWKGPVYKLGIITFKHLILIYCFHSMVYFFIFWWRMSLSMVLQLLTEGWRWALPAMWKIAWWSENEDINVPDSKVLGANMGPIWCPWDPGGLCYLGTLLMSWINFF